MFTALIVMFASLAYLYCGKMTGDTIVLPPRNVDYTVYAMYIIFVWPVYWTLKFISWYWNWIVYS